MTRSRGGSGSKCATARAPAANTAGTRQAIRARLSSASTSCPARSERAAPSPFGSGFNPVLPRALGAGSTAAELAWACPACNGHKYAKTQA